MLCPSRTVTVFCKDKKEIYSFPFFESRKKTEEKEFTMWLTEYILNQ